MIILKYLFQKDNLSKSWNVVETEIVKLNQGLDLDQGLVLHYS